MVRVCEKLDVSDRRACRVLGQARSTQRRQLIIRNDEDALTERIIELASCYGRYGYRRITVLLKREGWKVNHKRVERIWRQEGLRVPAKQPKRGRLWLNDGSCIRLRPTHRDHVWSYDFIHERTRDGRSLLILTVIDEYTQECLALNVAGQMRDLDPRQNEETRVVGQCLEIAFTAGPIPAEETIPIRTFACRRTEQRTGKGPPVPVADQITQVFAHRVAMPQVVESPQRPLEQQQIIRTGDHKTCRQGPQLAQVRANRFGGRLHERRAPVAEMVGRRALPRRQLDASASLQLQQKGARRHVLDTALRVAPVPATAQFLA